MKRLAIVCPNDWDRESLRRDAVRSGYELLFVGEELYAGVSLWRALSFDVHRWLDQTVRRLSRERLHGVVGTGDYPGCMLAAGIAEQLGLPSAGLRSVVAISHKLYSRELQRQVIPEATPEFEPLDPFADRDPERLPYPFFLKPVKGTMSIRAQVVRGPHERRAALRFGWGERLGKTLLLRPYQQLLERHSDRRVPAHFFIAEGLLGGDQVTVDGFVQDGQVTVMGIVDSVMYPGTRSFMRFDHPSRLPADVQARMRALVQKLIAASALNHTCFNVELFHEPATGALHVIEVNPRMSYQFADLYERVDGTNTYDLQLRLALGAPARWVPGGGRDRVAASFVMRRFSDARVLQVPGPDDLARVAERFPGATVRLLCAAGDRLSNHDQDVGSYRYCIVNLGARSEEALHAAYAEVERLLPFAFDRPEQDSSRVPTR